VGKLHLGRCRKCGKIRKLDSTLYCEECYPYGNSTDQYKQLMEADVPITCADRAVEQSEREHRL